MGELLRRRNMIIQAKVSPSGALYQLRQGQISASSGNGLINISGNHISNTLLVNGGVVAFVNGTTYWESDTPVEPWFIIPSGSVVTLKVKNITYNNPASSANRQTVTLRVANTTQTNVVSSGTISFAKNSQGTKADIEVASTLNSDVAVGAVRFQTTYGISASASFDVEVWVDDVRYL